MKTASIVISALFASVDAVRVTEQRRSRFATGMNGDEDLG